MSDFNLTQRPRRLRLNQTIRRLVRQTKLSVDDLILPVFIEEGITEPVAVESLPGIYRYPESMIPEVIKQTEQLGIPAIMMFGISHHKDDIGSDSWSKHGLQPRMLSAAKKASTDLIIMADSCFCEYTTHGHCGVIGGKDVDNDRTLLNLQKQAVRSVKAGADVIAPSTMMDGMVQAIRIALDDAGFVDTPIMSYSTKFASSFYGPFRGAVASTLKQTRDSYQMDPANRREAVLESVLDEQQGADMLMVKPGLAYLDVLAEIRQKTYAPLAVYHVSGEYAMVKFAAQAGAINEQKVVMESMIAFKRAGADMILTYYAQDIARWLQSS